MGHLIVSHSAFFAFRYLCCGLFKLDSHRGGGVHLLPLFWRCIACSTAAFVRQAPVYKRIKPPPACKFNQLGRPGVHGTELITKWNGTRQGFPRTSDLETGLRCTLKSDQVFNFCFWLHVQADGWARHMTITAVAAAAQRALAHFWPGDTHYGENRRGPPCLLFAHV